MTVANLAEPIRSDPLAQFLDGRRGGAPARKRDWILDGCREKTVLDVGCVQHSWRMAVDNPRWLHRDLSGVALSCTGVDYLEQDVEELRSRGFDVVYGNVLTDDPPGRYDRVVLGDILEHIESPVRLLQYTADALCAGGLAYVTTPNPFYLGQMITIAGRGAPTVNPEHVAFYDPKTFASLVERSPLEIVDLTWLTPSFPALWNSPRRLVRNFVSPLLHRLGGPARRRRPYLNSDFGAVLRLRSGRSTVADAADRAALVMDFHRGQR